MSQSVRLPFLIIKSTTHSTLAHFRSADCVSFPFMRLKPLFNSIFSSNPFSHIQIYYPLYFQLSDRDCVYIPFLALKSTANLIFNLQVVCLSLSLHLNPLLHACPFFVSARAYIAFRTLNPLLTSFSTPSWCVLPFPPFMSTNPYLTLNSQSVCIPLSSYLNPLLTPFSTCSLSVALSSHWNQLLTPSLPIYDSQAVRPSLTLHVNPLLILLFTCRVYVNLCLS